MRTNGNPENQNFWSGSAPPAGWRTSLYQWCTTSNSERGKETERSSAGRCAGTSNSVVRSSGACRLACGVFSMGGVLSNEEDGEFLSLASQEKAEVLLKRAEYGEYSLLDAKRLYRLCEEVVLSQSMWYGSLRNLFNVLW